LDGVHIVDEVSALAGGNVLIVFQDGFGAEAHNFGHGFKFRLQHAHFVALCDFPVFIVLKTA